MSDFRRCRRCKRRRLEDEPAEVRQYKTCAKCRIIERQKKRLRKPLAEETMLYGMKQFEEQTHAGIINDEGMMDDGFFAEEARNDSRLYDDEDLSPLQQHMQYQLSHQQPQQLSAQDDMLRYMSGAHHQMYQQRLQQEHQHYRSIPPFSSNRQNSLQQVGRCEICSNSLDNNDDLNMNYRLCLDCYTNPFRQPNVFEDYNIYLLEITKKKYNNIYNSIFIKEMNKDFSDSLFYTDRTFPNERLFWELVFNNIRIIYVDPLIASVGYNFNKVYSNMTNTSGAKAPIDQSAAKSNTPVNVFYRCFGDSGNATILVSFDMSTNILTIKFNQKVSNLAEKYSPEFISTVQSIVEKILPEDNANSLFGYDSQNALIVFDHLLMTKTLYSPGVQNIINKLNRNDFLRDFVQLGNSDANGKASAEVTKPEAEDVNTGDQHSNEVGSALEEESDEEEDKVLDDEKDIQAQKDSDVNESSYSNVENEQPSDSKHEIQKQIEAMSKKSETDNILRRDGPKPEGEYLDPAFGAHGNI